MALNRNYNYKDVDMLLASKTIVESFKSNIVELSVIRTNWNKEYANELSNKIDEAIDDHLGVDKKKELRNATLNLASIQLPALRDLSFIKTQLEVDFADDKPLLKELLNTLGFNSYLKQAQKNHWLLLDLIY